MCKFVLFVRCCVLFSVFFLFPGISVAQNQPFTPTVVLDISSGSISEGRFISVLNSDQLLSKDCSITRTISSECDSKRYLGNLGNVLNFDIYPSLDTNVDDLEITIVEEKRSSRLRSNLDSLAQIIEIILDASDARAGDSNELVIRKKINLKEKRALLKITVKSKSSGEQIERVIVTGPAEHWYLSADMMLTETKQLKFDSESNQLVERSAPSQFHIGFNYQFSDLFQRNSSYFDTMLFKAFFLADSRPLKSYGVGIGFRPKFMDFGNIYIAYHRTLEDELVEGAVSDKYKSDIRLGVGFNIDSALNWLKSN